MQAAFVFAGLFALAALRTTSAGQLVDTEVDRMPEVRSLYEFDTWKDREKLPGRRLSALPDLASVLQAHGEVRRSETNDARGRRYRLSHAGFSKRKYTDVTLELHDSAVEAKERTLHYYVTATRLGRIGSMAEAQSRLDFGDVCFFPGTGAELDRLQFTRANIYVRVQGGSGVSADVIIAAAAAIDAELVRLLETGEPVKTVAAGPDNVPSAAAARQPRDSAEAVESMLKAMPDEDARRLCLQKAQEMAKSPDDAPEQLLLFLRGLGPDEDPRQVAVLREIVRRSTNNAVRAQAVRVLAAWVSGTAETREDVLRVLGGLGEDPNPAVRQTVARTIAGSADVRHLPRLTAMMDDENDAVRRSAVEAICGLLGWDRPADADGEAAFRQRIEPVLSALRALEGTINAPAPPE